MAITIQNTPGSYYSAEGDLLFVVCDIVKASDPVLYPDYRYVCDVYIGSTLVARLKSYPRPDNLMGVFNISNIIRNYIAANFNPTANDLRAQEMGSTEFFITATCKFGEEYNFVLTTDITVDSARKYFGHYNGRLIGQQTNLSNVTDRPMTTRDIHTILTPSSAGTALYSRNKNNFVPFLPTDTDNVTLRIRSYTKNHALIDSKDKVYAPSAADTIQLFNVSPAVINAEFPGLVNPDIADYYTVQFLTPNIVLDRIIKFNLRCESIYEVFTIHFLNKYGGMESRDFTKVSRKVIDVEKQEFGKLGYTMDSSGVVSYGNSNNVLNETRTVYSSQYKEKLTLNSDILTDAEYAWLAELILSPMVYIEMANNSGTIYFVPCAIVSNNYEFRKIINDKLTNLTVSIEFGEQYNAQYR